MRQASNVSKHLAITTGDENSLLRCNEIVFSGTLGSAQVLNLDDTIVNFKEGKQFDTLLVDVGGE